MIPVLYVSVTYIMQVYVTVLCRHVPSGVSVSNSVFVRLSVRSVVHQKPKFDVPLLPWPLQGPDRAIYFHTTVVLSALRV
jgi:hypothetical protein